MASVKLPTKLMPLLAILWGGTNFILLVAAHGQVGLQVCVLVFAIMQLIFLVYVYSQVVIRPLNALDEWLDSAESGQRELTVREHAPECIFGPIGKKFHQTYDALHQQQLFSQVLLYSISDMIITVDKEGRIDYANPAALEWLGMELSMVNGQFLELIFDTRPSKEHLSQWVHLALEETREFQQDCRLSRISERDDFIEVNIQVNPLHFLSEGNRGAMVIIRLL
ncbi:PAS domain-containing protein [Vibrio sp. SCSIO 43136]|uniref:PAS domain-containing protein n=1 Tax=Vibrio sp. SCSIO 43136 TaxID=2819101 RepID=UPI0020755F9D|nr:PAS domain-containing protein [Vibrio sp. SCSIO 43136]USD67130.1 PAS domain-containing protein [Vibrio sp. SCSIO 43136]